VRFEQEKMSKSVGNVSPLGAALDEYGPEVLLMYFAGGHYRQPIAFADDQLGDAAARVSRVRELGRRLVPEATAAEPLDAIAERFFDALADDFNTPGALAELFAWIAEANRRLDTGEAVGPGSLPAMLRCLGLERLLDADEEAPDAEAEALLEEREAARREKDFQTADAARDRLRELGWEVRDTAEGPRLVRPG
jgi:cysteinyl-tRNA synthetase